MTNYEDAHKEIDALLVKTARATELDPSAIREKMADYVSSYSIKPEGSVAAYRAGLKTCFQHAMRDVYDDRNKHIATSYAHAFMRGDEKALSEIKAEITRLFYHDSYAHIQYLTQKEIKACCVCTHLPSLIVNFGPDNTITHPDISPEDKTVFHALFRDRSPLVKQMMEEEVFLSPSEAKEKAFAFAAEVGTRWNEANAKLYHFPSITNPKERHNYDSARHLQLQDKLVPLSALDNTFD